VSAIRAAGAIVAAGALVFAATLARIVGHLWSAWRLAPLTASDGPTGTAPSPLTRTVER
jgi:hypothetical protein